MLDRIGCRSLLAAALSASLLVLGSATAATTVPPAHIDAMTASLRASPVTFDVHLPLRDQAGLDALLAQIQDPLSPQYHKWLSAADFQHRFGPAPTQLAQVRAALEAEHMHVVQQGGTLHVSANPDSVERLFAAPLVADVRAGQQARLATAAPLQLPAVLRDSGATVTGLSRGPSPMQVTAKRVAINPDNRYDERLTAYWYNDLKQAYGYPSYQTMIGLPGKQRRLDGTGSTIAILMASDVLDSDINAMFEHEHFSRYAGNHANPKLYARRYVAGAKPGLQYDNDAVASEAALDVQMALGGAPGAHVILYVIPDLSESSILAGYRQIVQDNEADVVSSSFGGCELLYTSVYNNGADRKSVLHQYDAIFKQGNAQGITFVSSSGDRAGMDCPDTHYWNDQKDGKFLVGVHFPAASAHVTAVGGGNLRTDYKKGSLNSNYLSESAYADPMEPSDPYGAGASLSGGYFGAGGGVSTLFQRPAYQLGALGGTRTSMRSVPDVGMLVGSCPVGAKTCGDDQTGAIIFFRGEAQAAIGTSVAAPEFASVAALLVEKQGRQGNLNDYLYRLAANEPQAYHRGIPGNNGVVSNEVPIAGKYNYTTGLGTPIVRLMIGALDAAPAGIPRSPSNP